MLAAVLVTGSSGPLGRSISARLSAGGFAVVGVDELPGPATHVVGDIRRLDLSALVDGCAAIVHVAALHAPHVGHASDREFLSINVGATERLLDAARQAGVARFVFASTTSIYGHAFEDDNAAVWVNEGLEPRPRDIYDATKLEAEVLVASTNTDRLRTVALRIARCIPEPSRAVAVNRLYRGVDIRDVAEAFRLAIDVDLVGHNRLNIAGPLVFEATDCVQLRHSAASVIERRLPWLRAKFEERHWDLPTAIDRVYDSTLAGDVLGYKPRYGVRSALTEGSDELDAPGIPEAC